MRKIFLIGDSIRFGRSNGEVGYEYYLRQSCEGKAHFYSPNENCRFAQYVLRGIHGWAKEAPMEEIDTVHFNCGLWDVLHLDGDEALTPIPVYTEFLRRIVGRLRHHFPNAKLVFSTSTSVIEAWMNPDFVRYNREIEAYNAAACAVMAECGVQVCDLYTVSLSIGEDMRSDWVHYAEEGSRILADAVAKALGL